MRMRAWPTVLAAVMLLASPALSQNAPKPSSAAPSHEEASTASTRHKTAAQIAPAVSEAQIEAEYPELAKARHQAEAAIAANAWVLKIPHVKGMMPWDILDENPARKGAGETGIRIWVDSPENVPDVERQVPSVLDGIPVVIEATPIVHEL